MKSVRGTVGVGTIIGGFVLGARGIITGEENDEEVNAVVFLKVELEFVFITLLGNAEVIDGIFVVFNEVEPKGGIAIFVLPVICDKLTARSTTWLNGKTSYIFGVPKFWIHKGSIILNGVMTVFTTCKLGFYGLIL